jgi:hypothetical protein
MLNCRKLFQEAPWLGEKVEKIFIIPYHVPKIKYSGPYELPEYNENLIRIKNSEEDNIVNLDEDNFLIILDVKNPRVYDGKMFYPVTDDYFTLRCSGKILEINRNVIHIEYIGNVYAFKIGYKFAGSNEIVIQNKILWDLEFNYLFQNPKLFPNLEIDDKLINGQKNMKNMMVDFKKRQVGDKYIFQSTITENKFSLCSAALRNLPWLKKPGKVACILISPVENIDTDIYDINRKITVSGKDFYYVKKGYYDIRCLGKLEKISSDGIIIINFKGKIRKFYIAYKLYDEDLEIMTKPMIQQEIKYLQKINKSSEINIEDLKMDKNIDTEYFEISKGYLNEFSSNKKYNEQIVNKIRENSGNLSQFTYKIASLYYALKYNPIFSMKFINGYYNVDHINILTEKDFFGPVDINEIKDYIESIQDDIIILGTKYFDIPLRKNTVKLKNPEYKKFSFDIRSKCVNYIDVVGIDDVNIVYYESPKGEVFCYDIRQLYSDIKNNSFEKYNITFSDDFKEKILKIFDESHWKLQKQDFNKLIDPSPDFVDSIYTPDSKKIEIGSEYSFTPDILEPNLKQRIEDTEFRKILLVMREKLSSFANDNSLCEHCKIQVGDSNFSTLDPSGNQLKYCSRICFDNSENSRKKQLINKILDKKK